MAQVEGSGVDTAFVPTKPVQALVPGQSPPGVVPVPAIERSATNAIGIPLKSPPGGIGEPITNGSATLPPVTVKLNVVVAGSVPVPQSVAGFDWVQVTA
jgi:hypothetical protein